jgi:cell division protein FtsB
MSLTAAYTPLLETNRIRSMPSMRSPYWLFVVLILLLGGLQYRLWVGEGSLAQVSGLNQQIAEQRGENQRLLERNRILEAEVLELKQGMETVEERARHELGMVKEGETLYQLAE